MIRPSRIHLTLLIALLLAAVAPESRAAESRVLLVRGRVTGPDGWPVAGLTVAASGTRQARALTDGQGQYALHLPLPTAAEVAREPLRVRLAPVRSGWTFVRAGGSGAAGLEIDIVGPPVQARVRAPDAAFANAVANALTAKSVSVVFADLDFTGTPSTMEVADAPVEMPAELAVAVSGVKPTPHTAPATPPRAAVMVPPAGPPVPAPGAVRAPTPRAPRPDPDSLRAARAAEQRSARARADSLRAHRAAEKARAEARVSARRDSLRERERRAWRDSLDAAWRVSHPAAPSSDSCLCTIKGTIEARSDKRIPESLRITLWLADRPASRDSVVLFMGSPRPFEMRAPCGAHRLAIRVEPRLQRYTIGPPEALAGFLCDRTRPSQWRLSLNVK